MTPTDVTSSVTMFESPLQPTRNFPSRGRDEPISMATDPSADPLRRCGVRRCKVRLSSPVMTASAAPGPVKVRIPGACAFCAAVARVLLEPTITAADAILLHWRCVRCHRSWPVTSDELMEDRKVLVFKERRRQWSEKDRQRLAMYERQWADRAKIEKIRDEHHDKHSKVIRGDKPRPQG